MQKDAYDWRTGTGSTRFAIQKRFNTKGTQLEKHPNDCTILMIIVAATILALPLAFISVLFITPNMHYIVPLLIAIYDDTGCLDSIQNV